MLLAGEAGPEAIIPLSQLSSFLSAPRATSTFKPFTDPWKLWDEIKDLVDAIRELTETLADWIEEALNPLYDFEEELEEIIETTKMWIYLLEKYRDYLEKIGNRVLIAVTDDYLVSIAKSRLRESVVIAEGSLRRYKVTLENLGLKPSVMYVLLGIADTLAAYTRIQVEVHGKRLREVRSKLPLRWSL